MIREVEKLFDKRTGKTFIVLKTTKNHNALDETRGILLKYATKDNKLGDINPVEMVKRAWKLEVDTQGEEVK